MLIFSVSFQFWRVVTCVIPQVHVGWRSGLRGTVNLACLTRRCATICY